MRIAVLIIGLLLGLLMFLQTFAVYVLSDVADQDKATGAAAIGIVMALMWLVACALVIGFPMVSVVLFALAGLLGLAASGEFPDLAYWGGVSFILALMSFFGWRGKRKERRQWTIERQRQEDRDARLEGLLQEQAARRRSESIEPQAQPQAPLRQCPSCGHINSVGSKFCAECGGPLTSAVT